MAHKQPIQRYRTWYAKLLRFYPRPYYARFGEGMEQTFNDLCRERIEAQQGLFGFVLWIFLDTFTAIIKEETRFMLKNNKNLIRIPVGVFLLLLIPFILTIVNQRSGSNGWNWGPGDFLIMYILLTGAGLTFEIARHFVSRPIHQLAIGLVVAAGVFVIWVELAVDAVSKAFGVLFS